eukprot:scaffold818_cov64-Phaeocystis_antarctica.AAC.7
MHEPRSTMHRCSAASALALARWCVARGAWRVARGGRGRGHRFYTVLPLFVHEVAHGNMVCAVPRLKLGHGSVAGSLWRIYTLGSPALGQALWV